MLASAAPTQTLRLGGARCSTRPCGGRLGRATREVCPPKPTTQLDPSIKSSLAMPLLCWLRPPRHKHCVWAARVAALGPVAAGWAEPQGGCAHSSQPHSRTLAPNQVSPCPAMLASAAPAQTLRLGGAAWRHQTLQRPAGSSHEGGVPTRANHKAEP
jgi:hypothetical protein